MITKDSIKLGQKPTEEQLEMVRMAAQKPIVYDEDCPPLTEQQIRAFKCAVRQRNRLKKAN